MSFAAEKKTRDAFLFALYQEAKKANPSCPEAARIGFSKFLFYNPAKGQVVNNDHERGGYIIGERLGLSESQVDAFLHRFQDDNHMELTMGFHLGNLTSRGIRYLERLEIEPTLSVPSKTNNITIHNGSGTVQIQNESNHSNQIQEINPTRQDMEKIFALIEKDIAHLPETEKQAFTVEMDYARKQMERGKSPKPQFLNIGELIQQYGPAVMTSLYASIIWDTFKIAFHCP